MRNIWAQSEWYTGDHLRISKRKNQRWSPVYLALYGPEGSVIFDHPYNADYALWRAAGSSPWSAHWSPVLRVFRPVDCRSDLAPLVLQVVVCFGSVGGGAVGRARQRDEFDHCSSRLVTACEAGTAGLDLRRPGAGRDRPRKRPARSRRHQRTPYHRQEVRCAPYVWMAGDDGELWAAEPVLVCRVDHDRHGTQRGTACRCRQSTTSGLEWCRGR